MSRTMVELRNDHRIMARIFDFLAHEMFGSHPDHPADLYFVQDILDYSLNYPTLVHHPKEDLVFARLQRRAPEPADAIGDLEAEHSQMESLARRFAAAVDEVAHENQFPRESLADIASDFLGFARLHMQMEETTFFPSAVRALRSEDWHEIDGMFAGLPALRPNPTFQRLRERTSGRADGNPTPATRKGE